MYYVTTIMFSLAIYARKFSQKEVFTKAMVAHKSISVSMIKGSLQSVDLKSSLTGLHNTGTCSLRSLQKLYKYMAVDKRVLEGTETLPKILQK